MRWPLISRAQYDRDVTELSVESATWKALAEQRVRERVAAEIQCDTARADLAEWRATARQALRDLAALQLRYAPPAPIEGEVEQPQSVDDADRAVLDALREAEATA